MDEIRKNAYRNLLYRATIDIRTLCQSRGKASRNPWEWYRQYQRSRVAGALADWLHNLAYCAARDFEGFNEEEFWREYEGGRKLFPELSFESYHELFEHFLKDPEHTKLW